jgi:hypothetical protein
LLRWYPKLHLTLRRFWLRLTRVRFMWGFKCRTK